MRTTDHTERPENSCTAAGRVVPVVLTGLMAGALAFGVAAPAHAAGDSPAPPSGTIASAATRESTPVTTSRPTSSSTSRPVAEPISRDKVIVRDDAPAAVATIEPGAEEAPSEQGEASASDAPAASATDEADGRDEASQASGGATTASPTPTASPQTAASTESPTATATLTAVPTVAPLGIAVPKLERPTRVPEAPLTPRPWKAYPVPADPSPAKPSPKSTSTVPVLARGMSMSAMAAQRGVKVAAAPAEEESAISSTVLGLFGLSLLAAGATLLVAVRARAKR